MVMLLGKKVGMTQIYDESSNLVPVTVIKAGPCDVLQVKTTESDGYNAVQLGIDEVKPSRRKRPEVGHAKKAGVNVKKFVREMRLLSDSEQQYNMGDSLTVSVFQENDIVDIVSTSKGKGYAGVMKRHHFGGFPASHGTERKHRAPGSQASCATDRGHGGNIKKGKRMSGHLGSARVTSKNHKLIKIDSDNGLLIVKGSIPGCAGSYCVIKSAKK